MQSLGYVKTRLLRVAAAVSWGLLLPPIPLLAQADTEPPIPAYGIAYGSSSCQHAFSPLNALAERTPHTTARLARSELRDVGLAAANPPNDAKLSLAVNVLNLCGGALVLPDLTVLTIDPLALGEDRLVRVSKMAGNSLIVQLSPFDPHQPISLSDHTLHHYRVHDVQQPQITFDYPVNTSDLPDRLPHQVFMHNGLARMVALGLPNNDASLMPRTHRSSPPSPLATPTSTPTPKVLPTAALPRPTSPPRPLPTPPTTLAPSASSQPSATPVAKLASQMQISRTIIAAAGGRITLEAGPSIIIGPQALNSNATVTLHYNPIHPAFAGTTNYVPSTGTLRVVMKPVNPNSANADPINTRLESTTPVILVTFPHPEHIPVATNGLTIMRASYLDGHYWNQTESNVQTTPNGDTASFSAVLIRGTQATFSIERYVSPVAPF